MTYYYQTTVLPVIQLLFIFYYYLCKLCFFLFLIPSLNYVSLLNNYSFTFTSGGSSS